jgi:predicted alpha/beta-hydrolase family hydrolase
MPMFLYDGPQDSPTTVILAHGAGVPMDSAFMEAFATGIAAHGHRVVRFEFPYMAARRTSERRPPPDREAVLLATWREVIAAHGPTSRLVVGGKSMGGRMASMVADEAGVRGLVCLGYPFHAPGAPEKARIDHLKNLRTPALIVQGTRDPFGTKAEVAGYLLSPSIGIHWLEDGDHDFKPRASSGRTQEQNWAEGIDAVGRWLAGRPND